MVALRGGIGLGRAHAHRRLPELLVRHRVGIRLGNGGCPPVDHYQEPCLARVSRRNIILARQRSGNDSRDFRELKLVDRGIAYLAAPTSPFPKGIEFRLERTIVKPGADRSEEHTSELQSPCNLVCRLLLGKTTDRSPAPLSPSSSLLPHATR